MECLGQHYQPTIGQELIADIRLPPDLVHIGLFGLCVSVDGPGVCTFVFVCVCCLLPTMQRYSGTCSTYKVCSREDHLAGGV